MPERPTSTAERAERGRAAEQAVQRWLRAHGFQIVATNLRVSRYEIDIVARQGALIVVVEVRTRGGRAWTRAFGSMDREKRLRIRRAGEWLWQRRYRNDATVERMRFDAASVSFEAGAARVEYAAGAF